VITRVAPAAARTVAAGLAGVALMLAFPPGGRWWLAPLAVTALLLVLTHADGARRRSRTAFWYGLVFGLGFTLPLLHWIDAMVGALPWIGLAVACSLFYGAFGAAAVRLQRAPAGPLWVAAAFTVTEWARSSFPFGGFPWGRLAFSQADGPLLPLARFIGAPGLGFAVALLGAAFAAAITAGVRRAPRRAYLVPAGAVLGTVVVAAVAVPTVASGAPSGRVTVAAIQGNVPRLGYNWSTQRAAVLNNHLAQTRQLARDVAAGRAAQPDVVIWPENSSDIPPERDPDTLAKITAVSAEVRAPILVGTVHFDDQGRYYNSMIMIGPDGVGDRHDKAILQPFGETMPMRSFFRHFTSLVDLANNFTPGHGDGVVRPGSGPAKDLPIGIATCYEVAFDRALRGAVNAGAQVLTVPTNNATFGHTGMTYQQLGMSRVRAVELDRQVIVAATTGVSAMVAPNGAVTAQTTTWKPAYLVATVPLRTTRTPASRLGDGVNFAALALVVCGVALLIGQHRRSVQSSPETGERGDR
jgi:apolipoprotein N-acyltransferase